MIKETGIGAGIGVLLIRNSKILLGKRHVNPEKASSLLHGAGTWTMPGGKLHFGETFEVGARREILEETGRRRFTFPALKFLKITKIRNFTLLNSLSVCYRGD